MEINNRTDIKNLILYIEKNFKVNEWKIDDVHIWPLLRIKLYLSLVFQLENPKEPKPTSNAQTNVAKKSFIATVFNRVHHKYKRTKDHLKLQNWIKKLPQKEHLFLGDVSRRVVFKECLYNRFFDTFIEQNKIEYSYLYLERGQNSKEIYYNPEKIFFFEKYHQIYSSATDRNALIANVKISLEGYFDFIAYIKKLDHTAIFLKEFNENNINKVLINFKIAIDFYTLILQHCKPTSVYVLCYYSVEFLSFIAAANKLGINTVEYQHGPQMDLHLAYSNWSNIPKEGYSMLPCVFWNWDIQSAQTINQWAHKHTLYSSKVVGNFWVDYWKKNQYQTSEIGYILYALQPTPLTLEQLFPAQLIDFIKNQPYKWYIRLHPRQFDNKPAVVKLLKENAIFDCVELEKASTEPLPLLLANCMLHVTHFSGSTIEAAQMGVKTILLNSFGAASYQDLLKSEMAYFVDPKDLMFAKNLISKFESK